MNWKKRLVGPLLILATSLVTLHASADELIQRGKYLSIAGDCVACHSAPGGKPFAGGLGLPTPIGEIIANQHHSVKDRRDRQLQPGAVQ